MRSSLIKIFGLFGLLFSCSVDLASGEIRYGRQIRPILSDKCFFCHGTDPKTREGDLRLDIREDALKGKAFVPGEPGKSTLIQLINASDEDEMMPPPKTCRAPLILASQEGRACDSECARHRRLSILTTGVSMTGRG